MHTGHTPSQGCTNYGFKTGTHLDPAWVGVWFTMSWNCSWMGYRNSQSICGCICKVGKVEYKQPSNGVTCILTTHHPKDGLIMGEN